MLVETASHGKGEIGDHSFVAAQNLWDMHSRVPFQTKVRQCQFSDLFVDKSAANLKVHGCELMEAPWEEDGVMS